MATHKHFTIYQQLPFDSTSTQLRIDGVYFKKDNLYGNFPLTLIFFYGEGSALTCYCHGMSTVPETDFWNQPERYLVNMKKNIATNEGHYNVRKDKFVMQVFDIDPGALFPIDSREYSGYIKNDSTLVLTGGNCSWCHAPGNSYDKRGNTNYDEIEYKFYKTDYKPDSSVFWFKNKKWYRHGIWNNKSISIE
jgi:hypothetical protein